MYFMGRGDKKSRKGKIFKGSFGKTRLSASKERRIKKKAQLSAPKK
jgi:ribosomal small subunit protein bTHX